MVETSKLKKYLVTFFAGEAILFFASFISFPIFTRILSKNDYGIMSLINLTLSLAVTLGSAGLRNSILRFHSVYKGQEKIFFSTTFLGSLLTGITTVFVMTLIAILLLIFNKIEMTIFYLVLLASPIVLIRLLNFLQNSFFRIKEQTKSAVALDIILRYGGVSLSIFFVFLLKNVYGFFSGIMVAEALVLVFLMIKTMPGIDVKSFDLNIFKVCLLFGLPLMMESLVSYLLSGGDRYIINYFLGPSEVANYSVVYTYCEFPLAIARNVFNYAFMPIILNLWNDGHTNDAQFELNRYFKLYVWLAIPIVFGISAVAQHGIVLLAGMQYTGLTYLTPIIAAGIVFNGMNFVTTAGLIFKKKTMLMLKITLSATILNFILNFIFIPIFGLLGAALATLVAYVYYFMISMILSRKEFSFPIPYGDICKSLFCSIVMYCVVRNLSEVTLTPIIAIVCQIAAGVVIYGLCAVYFWRKQFIFFH